MTPNGTFHATSPVFTLIAHNWPQGGCWQGQNLSLFQKCAYVPHGLALSYGGSEPGLLFWIFPTSPKSIVFTNRYPSLGFNDMPCQLVTPIVPGNITVISVPKGVNGPLFFIPPSCAYMASQNF